MKEPFVDVGSLINQATTLSDMELQAYLSSLSPNQKSDFTASNVADAINSVKAMKQQRYNDMAAQVLGADNNITAAAYYTARTQDLKNMAHDVDNVAIKQLMTSDINAGLVGRQNEINEWSNFNKLDTLFFMQVLFICLTFVSGILFLKTQNMISQSLFTLLAFLAAFLAFFALITRARKTSVLRDSRYWHKMRFPKQQDPFPTKIEDPTCPTVSNPSGTGGPII
jgi:HAMP domain-containing protein